MFQMVEGVIVMVFCVLRESNNQIPRIILASASSYIGIVDSSSCSVSSFIFSFFAMVLTNS